MYPPPYTRTIDAKPPRRWRWPRIRHILEFIGKAIIWILSMIIMGIVLYYFE